MKEPLIQFTVAHNSIDFVGAFFFVAALAYSLHYLYENHITVQGRIMYFFIIVISSLYIYQTFTQLMTNTIASFRIWDIINYLNAIFMLMVCHRLARK